MTANGSAPVHRHLTRRSAWVAITILAMGLVTWAGFVLWPGSGGSESTPDAFGETGVSNAIAGLPSGENGLLYVSRAILELQSNAPPGSSASTQDIRNRLSGVRTRMLRWNSVRDIILSKNVDFGREVGPEDRSQIEALYDIIRKSTRVSQHGSRHIAVTFRSRDPERNARLVNELVRSFLGESRREAMDRARIDAKYYNDKLAVAKNSYNEVASRVREFDQANPWLGPSLREMYVAYEDAQVRELAAKREGRSAERELESLKTQLESLEKTTTEEVTVPPSGALVSARDRLSSAEYWFEFMAAHYTKSHKRCLEAEAKAQQARAEVERLEKEGYLGGTIERTKLNPEYPRLVAAIEKKTAQLADIAETQLILNKRTAEFYGKCRRTPELLARRQAMNEEAEAARATAEHYAKDARAADRELQRQMYGFYSSQFKVIEYARPSYMLAENEEPDVTSTAGSAEDDDSDSSPISPASGSDSMAHVIPWAAGALALGVAIGAIPAFMLLLMVIRERSALPESPVARKGGALLRGLVAAACLAMPLAAVAGAVIFHGVVHDRWPAVETRLIESPPVPSVLAPAREPVPSAQPELLDPITVEQIVDTGIRFAQLDINGLQTTITYFFREAPLQLDTGEKGFVIARTSATVGVIGTYHLVNCATGKSFEFEDVKATRISGAVGWRIADDGWKQVRDELRARMQVQLSLPVFQ
ncbi:hypothetical protein HQ560_05435 [bacterium]|nr:hypothetical protein [bacterium]